MFKNKFKTTFFVVLLLIVSLLMLSCVNASEDKILENQTSYTDLSVSEIEVENNVLSVPETHETPASSVQSEDVLNAPEKAIYVSPTASTTDADGSREHPYSTISTALSYVVSPQSTEIVLMDGVYSGSSNNYLTFSKPNLLVRPDEGANPIISFTHSSSSSSNRWSITARNITFDGIKFTNTLVSSGSSTSMIYVDSSTVYDFTVANCDFDCIRGSRAIYMRYGHNLLIENCTMTGYSNNANQAIAIYNAYDVVVRNNTIKGFMGTTASNSGGGAVQTQYVTNAIIEDNTIMNVKAANGGAIYQYSYPTASYPVIIRNNLIINSSSTYAGGGAIHVSGSGNEIYNNIIINSTSKTYGGAIYLYGYDNTMINNSMYNCRAPNSNGGGVYITYSNNNIMKFEGNSFVNCTAKNGGGLYSYLSMDISDSDFINCSAVEHGGAVYFYDEYTGRYVNIDNSTFTNNKAGLEGGAIYSTTTYPTISNSTFENNTASDGGAISFTNRYTYGNNQAYPEIYNTTFTNNSALNGGAIYSHRIGSGVIDNTKFIANNATLGGAVFIDYPHASHEASSLVEVTDSKFENNTAYSGGALILYSSNSIVENCTFILNNATRYGGGALISGGKGNKIINSTFINNTGYLYAGAIGSNNTEIINNTFENNTAYQGGAILTINSTIENNTFSGNNATRGKDIVYIDTYKHYTPKVICNCTNCTNCSCKEGECSCENATMETLMISLLEGNDLDEDNVYVYDENELLRVAKNQYGKYYLYKNPMTTAGDYYYWAYCIEQNNSVPLEYNGTDGIKVDDLTFVRNSLDQSYVGDYIKVLLIMYQDEIYNLKDYIYVFTDGDYLNSKDPIIKNVINVTHDESTYLRNGLNIVNGSFSCYWFSTFINPTSRQNLILINACKPIEYAGFTPTKTPSVSSAAPNSDVIYTVTILNDRDVTLHDIVVTEKLGSGDWYISGWQNPLNDAWTRTGEKTWVLNRPLAPGDMAKFNVICHVGANNNGNTLSNTVDIFTRETGYQSTTSSITTKKSSIKIEKIALTRYVAPGELAYFKIVVTNNGPTTVSNIRVDDVSTMSQLEYMGWSNDVGTWSNNGWSSSSSQKTIPYSLSGSLAPGQYASFFVYFKVPANVYSAQNNANLYVSGSNVGSDYDTVYTQSQSMSISKIPAYGSQVQVNNQITFRVTVNGYSATNQALKNIYVEDLIPEGLVYQSWSGSGWAYAGDYSTNEEKPRWVYTSPLIGSSTTNPLYITCKATKIGYGTNTATAYADGQTPKTSTTGYTVVGPSVKIQKTANTSSIYMDDKVSFTIGVTNNGNIALNDVTVFDSFHPKLEYVSFSDPSGKWIKGNALSWTYNGSMAPNQYSSFNVIFKATETGTAYNAATVTTKEGPTDESSTYTTVLTKQIIGSKVASDKVVEKGSRVSFTITVSNNYGSTLHNLYIDEVPDEGLEYVGYVPLRGGWSYDSVNKRYTISSLSYGDYASIKVNYIANKTGTLTNTIYYSANELTKVYTSSDDIFVRNPHMTIEKIPLKDIIYLGDEVGFVVRINNTGNIVLNHVYVNETSFEGLEFTRWENLTGYWRQTDNGDGTYSFKLYGNLAVNSTASFIVFFSTDVEGNYTNIVKGGSDQTTVTEVNNTTSVEKCLLKIEKITKTQIVPLHENATFTINVTNIGDETLTDVFVREMSYDGLQYLDYKPVIGDWKYEEGIFRLNSELASGRWATFDIIFNTTKVGNITNIVQGTYKGSRNVTANNTTFVIHPNMELEKITVNKTVMLNENVTFTIVVKNNGDYDLSDVVVKESEYDGLINPKFVSNVGTWKYENGEYKLLDALKIGQSASLNITFTAIKQGNLTNIVVARSNLTREISANNTTFVQNPDLTVVKLTLTERVLIHDTAVFQIIVNNTGNVDLTEVFVNETSCDGLNYLHIENVRGEWKFEDGLFKLIGKLTPGDNASFNIVFSAEKPDNLTNTVEAGSNETGNSTASNKTFVENPILEVQKLTLNKTVRLGENVTYTIIVNNTGNVRLTNVTVEEYLHPGLKYESYVPVKGKWIADGAIFTLDEPLQAGDWASFNVVFLATASGNLTNTVVAKSNETDEKLTNSTTFSQDYNFVVSKITLTPVVTINEEAKFLIIVENTGNMNLTEVFVKEIPNDGLRYSRFEPVKGEWKYLGGRFIVDEIPVGENASLIIIFTAEKEGLLNNTVVAGSDNSSEKPANNTTYVENPLLSIEKLTLDESVIIGDEVTFTIIVKNMGNIPLNDITVSEIPGEGLEMKTYNDVSGEWSYVKSSNSFKLNGPLTPGENASFNIVFITSKIGNLTNTVTATSNRTEENTAENKTDVLPICDVSIVKLVDKSIHKLGEDIVWTVIVKNNGRYVAENVFVKDLSDDNLSEVGGIVSKGTYANGIWNVGTLAPGEVQNLTLTTIAKKSNVTVFNNASVSTTTAETDKTNNNASNSTFILNPELTVKKITLNNTVLPGEDVIFTIIVNNTGDVVLHNIFVKEASYEGLVLDNYDEVKGTWFYSKSNNVFRLEGALNPGEYASINVIFKTTNVLGKITNVVIAGSDESKEKTVNNTTFVRDPVLDIRKITVNRTVYHNDEVIFTIIVENSGNIALGNVTVRELDFSGLEYLRYANGTRNWIYEKDNIFTLIGSLDVGEKATFDVIFRAANIGNFTNTVVASSNDTSDKKASNTTEVLPICDVEITKLVDSHVHYLGENIVWTIIVKNNGPDDALNVNVTDKLPDTLTLLKVNASKGDYTDGVWIIGTLKPNEIHTLTLTTIPAKSNITIRNTATVSTSTVESDTENNEAYNTTEIKQKANLVIEKTVSDSTPKFGDVIVWTITVTNKGPDTAENIVISDKLPAGLILVSGNLINNIGSLAPGESTSITIETLVNTTGNVTNIATVSTDSNNTGNNKTNTTIEIPHEVKLDITKDVSNPTPKHGDTVVWTITVTNKGPDTAENVVITDKLPARLILVSGNLINNIGSLAPGESTSITIETLVNTTGNITNIATVSTDSNNTGNNKTNTTIEIPHEVKLDITKNVSNPTPKHGDIIVWTITVTNKGLDIAKNVVISDKLPAGLILVSDSLINNIGSIAPGESISITIETLVNTTGNITNIATVSTDSNNTGNNKTNATIEIPHEVKLDITKNVSNPTPKHGDIIVWTITVTNKGPDTAENVVITDKLPAGLILVSGNLINNIGSLAPGESTSITLETLVNTTGNVINIATLSTDSNNTGKNETNKSIDVPKVAIITIEVISNTTPTYGAVVNWTIIITNSGDETAENVTVIYEIPEGLILLENPINQIGPLLPFQRVNVNIVGVVNTTDPIQFVVVTSSNSTDNITYTPVDILVPIEDTNDTNDSAVPISDLEIKKVPNVEKAFVGDYLVWTITVKNNGPDTANNVIVHEYLPKELKYVSYTATKGTYSNGIWKIDTILNGETVILKLKTKVLATGNIINPVEVICDSDSNLTNNKANATITSLNKENKTQKTHDTKTNSSENIAGKTSDAINEIEISEEQTANPIAVMLLALFCMVAIGIKRK